MLGRLDEPVHEQQDSPSQRIEPDNTKCSPVGAYFTSTQMQLRHEALEEKEREDARIASTISRLQSFSNKLEATISFKEADRPEKAAKKDAPKSKGQQKRAKPKPKTMNNIVRETFDGSELSYFSGHQKKIDHFVKTLKKDKDVRDLDSASNANFFTKTEWSELVKRLKEKFPNLLSSGKKTLKAINRRVQDLEIEQNANASPMWTSASSHPDAALSSEDSKWLYDLDEHQMANSFSFSDHGPDDPSSPFVLTLSQTASVSSPQKTRQIECEPKKQTVDDKDAVLSIAASCEEGDWNLTKSQTDDFMTVKKLGATMSPTTRFEKEEINEIMMLEEHGVEINPIKRFNGRNSSEITTLNENDVVIGYSKPLGGEENDDLTISKVDDEETGLIETLDGDNSVDLMMMEEHDVNIGPREPPCGDKTDNSTNWKEHGEVLSSIKSFDADGNDGSMISQRHDVEPASSGTCEEDGVQILTTTKEHGKTLSSGKSLDGDEFDDLAVSYKIGEETNPFKSSEQPLLFASHQQADEILRQSQMLFGQNTRSQDAQLVLRRNSELDFEVISDSDPDADSILLEDTLSCSEENVTSHQQPIASYEIDSADGLCFPETPNVGQNSPKLQICFSDDAIDSICWLTGSSHQPKKKSSISSPRTPTRNLTTQKNEDEVVITSVERPERKVDNAFATSQLDEDDIFCTAPSECPPPAPLSNDHGYQDDENSERTRHEFVLTDQRTAKRQKILHTSMYETRTVGDSEMYVNDDLGIVMRKVGTRLDPIDLDNEVPDSDAESGDGVISIYEITREIEPDHVHDAEVGSQANAPEPTLQVPSSPLVVADGILDLLPASSSPYESPKTRVSDDAIELEKETEVRSQFSQMTTEQLKKTLVDWGLKPLRGREKMLKALDNTQKLVQSSQTENVTESTQHTREVIFEAITKLIKLDWEWHEKIVSFEPLRIADLLQWLSVKGHKLELNLLEQYCDELGICCTNQG